MEEKQKHEETSQPESEVLEADFDQSEVSSLPAEISDNEESEIVIPIADSAVDQARREFYDSVKDEIYEYSVKRKIIAYLFWFITGIFGGHRYYLGQNRSATIMMFTVGGLTIWWFVDLFLIHKMLRKYNTEQQRRKENKLPPIELDQFELIDSGELITIPDWSGYKRRKFLRVFGYILNFPWVLGFYFTFAPVLILKILPMPAKMKKKRDRLFAKGTKALELVSLIGLSYMLSYIAGYNFILEIGLIVILISALMAFPDLLFKHRDKAFIRSLLKWDYLYRSYYFKHPPFGFYESLARSLLNVFMVMFGDRKARMEFNLYIGMIVLLGALTIIFLPLDIFNIMVAEKGDIGNSISTFIELFFKNFYMTLFWIASFLPTLGGTFARYELKKETRYLKYVSLLSFVCVVVGFIHGIINSDNYGPFSSARSLIGL